MAIHGTRDERIAAIARLQRGRVARSQLFAVGISRSQIRTMLASGRLYRLHASVYAVGHLAPIEFGRETAALLAAPETAVLSHQTAAALWNLRPALSERDPIDVTVRDGKQFKRPGIRAHRTRTLEPRDIRIHERLPVTSPARTALDMAELVSAREVERTVEEGIARNILRISQIRDTLARASGRRGSSILTHVLENRTGSTHSRSETEERMLGLIRQAQLPPVEMNIRLHGFTVDFLWRERRVVLEVDGYPYHSSRSAFERDRRKDAALRAAGYDVIRVSMSQVWDDPYVVIALLARALAESEALSRPGGPPR